MPDEGVANGDTPGPGDHQVQAVPFIPSTDGARLATVLRAASWSIDDAAHLLPAGRCTPDRLHGLATVLRQLAAHLDAASGIPAG